MKKLLIQQERLKYVFFFYPPPKLRSVFLCLSSVCYLISKTKRETFDKDSWKTPGARFLEGPEKFSDPESRNKKTQI